MLYCYSQLDYRVRPLVLSIKKWAKQNNINEARFQTLSSYTLSLMVIHYLQSGVSPPVLPCLQKLHPQIFNSESDIFSLEYRVPPGYQSANRDSLGKLFVGFFLYYTDPRRYYLVHHSLHILRCMAGAVYYLCIVNVFQALLSSKFSIISSEPLNPPGSARTGTWPQCGRVGS